MNIHRYSFLIIGILFALSCSENKTGKEGFVTSGDPEIDRLTLELQKNDKDPKLYAMRGTKYYEKESFDNAIVDFKQAIRLDSLNPIYYHQLADTYLDYYNSKDAIGTLLQVLQMYPERIPTLLKLAEFKHIVEDYDGSILTLNEVVRLDPQNAESYFMLGMNFRALGDRERAINSFQTAVENDSQLTDAWLILGDLYEEKKDPKALKYYESAILSNPNSMEALHSKAFYLQNHGKIQEAKQIYRDIILQDKNYEAAYLNSGVLYMEQDSLDLAYEQFNILAGVNPKNYMGFYMRAQVEEKRGKPEAAKRDYESAYNLNPKDEKLTEALNNINKLLAKNPN
ncbi:MAG: tetratricopeptide repeat protein [Saprospiraceae bacterium]|nr:tetratricopeptide repeat protein [Saprospiraceae bacterium]